MKVLCFAPNDAVWRWTLPQAQFLESLKQRGDEIIYIHCDRTLRNYCMSMACLGVTFKETPERKDVVCKRCCALSQLTRSRFGFEGHSLASFVSDDEIARADALSEQATVDELLAQELDGIPIGRIAVYEAVIQTKHSERQIDGDAEKLYRLTFRNTMIVGLATTRMLDRFKPDVCVSYHTAYAYNRTFLQLAEKAGVTMYSLNASFNVSELDTHLAAAKADPEKMFKELTGAWESFRDVVCTRDELSAAAEHLLSLMSGGGFAYSVAMRRNSGMPAGLRCPDGKKLALVLLSSYDELLASDLAAFGWSTHNTVFASQIEWIRWLFDFASGRPDLHFVIRVHPREFPIQGKGTRSQHAVELEEVFSERPSNVAINLPSDAVPLYSLLVEADVALVAWSSAGMEAGMLGIPVVTYFGDALLYPRALVFDAQSREQYKEMVEAAVDCGWSIERARAYFRWAVLMLHRTRIGVTAHGPKNVTPSRLMRFWMRAFRYLARKVIPYSDEKLGILSRPRRLQEAEKIYELIDRKAKAFYTLKPPVGSEVSARAELDELRTQLARIAAQFEKLCGTAPRKLQEVINSRERPLSERRAHP